VQLRRLEVSNIRSFESGRLELGPGTTLLVGDVGAGKSSLLYGVEMALFGVAEVDAAYLVRHGTSHAEVAVTLADDRHAYTIRRRFRKVRRRGRETFEPERLTFAEDGRPTAYSSTEIRQRVIELLGFPDNPNPHAHSDLWRWAIYVPQERMREILAADPEERLETVRKALGVERYRTAAENAQALASDLRVSARRRREEAGRMAHWDLEFAETTREADGLRAERVALASGVAREEQALGAARQRRQAAEEVLARLESDRRERDGLRREAEHERRAVADLDRRRATLAAEREQARKEGEALKVAAADRARAQAARAAAEETVRAHRLELERSAEALRELARDSAALDAAERRVAETADRSATARHDRDDAERTLAALLEQSPSHDPPCPTPRTVGDLERELAGAREAEHGALDALARARASLAQVTELLAAGICPTCGQPVRPEEFSAHRDEATRAVEGTEAARASGAALRERLEEERKSRERYDRAHERWLDLDRRRQEARELVARRATDADSADAARRAATEERAGALHRVQERKPAEAEEARHRAALARAERALADATAADQQAAASEERLRSVAALVERLSDDLDRLASDLEALRSRVAERTTRLAAVDARLAEADAASRDLESARSLEVESERRLTEARAALVRSDTRLDGLVERLATAERGRAERAALVVEATDLEAKADWVGEPFRFAVLRMEKELLAHAQVAFDRAFARFFASLIDDRTLTARTDVSFTPEVTIAGQATPAEALSGGERTSLALAFRLALASVVRSLGTVRLQTLLLDEPTDGFSTEQVVRMGELLEELALPQVVLVSHENELAGVADRTVRVVKVDGRSTLELDGSSDVREEVPAEDPGTEAPSPRPARSRRR
jgi:DNA repair protein SbcC/Rad50